MHWKTKAAAFRLLDALPAGHALHFWLQRYATRSWPRRDDYVEVMLERAQRDAGRVAQLSGKPLAEATFLEVGAGRDLTVPLALRAIGVGKVVTVDIERLAKLDLVNHAASVIRKLTGVAIPEFHTWDDLKAYGIDYRAPSSIEEIGSLPGLTAFVSNEVLEHVPPAPLRTMVSAAYRLLEDGGFAVHAIDYSDHYARGGGVSRYNFLTYSDDAWRPYNTGLQYVNRLRHSEYLGIFRDAGFAIVEDAPYAEAVPPAILENLADRFAGFEAEDLAIMRSRIIARKGAA